MPGAERPQDNLDLEDILRLYAQGAFPMADAKDNARTIWYTARMRAVLPIARVHVGRKLRGLLRRDPFEMRTDTAFAAVLDGCTERRDGQWINPEIKNIFNALHAAGHAHSVECWQGGNLVGGLYGLAQGGAFCAESMFSRVPNASKVALVHLCARLEKGGFSLLDCQLLNEHTRRFGAYEIPEAEYLRRLALARGQQGVFAPGGPVVQTPLALVLGFLEKQKSVEKVKNNLTIS